MKTIALLVGLAALGASLDAAAAPGSVSFSGRLSTSAGPVDGPVNITFTIFDTETNGSSVWTDTVAVTASQGLVFATLGRADYPLDETVFTGASRFLEISVQGETLSPRLAINASPYAVRSSVADSAARLGTLAPGDVVTSVKTGAGLVGSGSGGAVLLSVDSSTIQSRIGSTCGVGSAIRAVNPDGTVVCDPHGVAGVQQTGFTPSVSLDTTTSVALLSFAVPGTPSGNLAVTAHAFIEKDATTTGRYELTLHLGSCAGTMIGLALWRPLTGTGFEAVTTPVTGFASTVTSADTVFLCGRKFDSTAPTGTVGPRGMIASW